MSTVEVQCYMYLIYLLIYMNYNIIILMKLAWKNMDNFKSIFLPYFQNFV